MASSLVPVLRQALAASACVLAATPLPACTTFCSATGDGALFGRNYDFEIGDGVLLVNPRGLAKRGLAPRGPSWTARLGSVTFDQFGRDLPMGGMNERGLVVELLWLDATRYPPADARPALGVLEWVQYQLDTAASVAEVLASDAAVRIEGETPLHYLVADASGAAAAVEFLDGKTVVHAGARLPVAALANSTYEESLRFWRAHGERSRPRGDGSEARFARAATQARDLGALAGPAAIARAFAILADTADGITRWSIVYDLAARAVHFRTQGRPDVRTLRLAAEDLSCARAVRFAPLDATGGDLGARLRPFRPADNRALVERTFPASSVTRRTAPERVRAIAAHPDAAVCARS